MDSISFVYDPPMISDEFLKGPAVALSPEAEAFVLSSPFNPMGLKVKPTIGEETQPKRLQFTEKKAPLNIHQGSPINPDLLKSIAPYIPTSLRTGTEKKFVAPVAPKVKKTVPIHQEGFKSIPVMVGPESLPYARNPSGVDGSVLDSDGRLNVWRPSVDDPEPEHLDHLHFQRRPGAPNPPHRAVSQEEDNSSAYAHPSMFRVYTMRDKAAMMNKSQQPFSTNKVSASYIPSSFPVRSPSMSTNPSHVSSLPIPSSRSPLPSGNRLDHAQHSLHSNQSAHREHDFSHLHPSYPVSSSDPRRFNELPTGQQYPSQGPDGFLQAQMGLVHDPMFLGQDILHLTASLLNLGLDPAVVLLHTARHMALMNSGLPSELIPYASRANASMHLGFDRSPSPGGPQIFSPQHVENSTEWATPASNSSVHYHAPLHVAPRISPSLSPTLVDVHQDVLPHLIDLAALDSDPVLPKIQVESIAHYRDDQVRIPSPYPIGDFIVPSLEHEKQLLKELKPAANLFAPPMDALPMAFESVSKPREESFLSTVHSVELPIVKTRSLTESALKPSWEEPIFLPAGSGAGFANGGLRLCGPRAKVPRRSIEEMALEAIEVACTWEEPAESSALKRERISLTEAIEATKEAARQEAIRKTREENEMKMRVLAEIEVANSRMKNQQLKEEKGGGKKIVEVKAGLPGRVVSGAAGDPSKSKKESYLTLGGLNKMFSEPPLGVNVSDSPLHQTRRVISEPVYKQNFRSSSTALMSGLPQKPAVKSSATTPSKSKLPVRAKALPVSKTSDSDTAGSVEHTARVSRKSKNSRPSNRAQVSKPFSSVLK
ncbi:hypothetical protein [Phaffia rhodozyma]|uniref:Uncharacterized protein n=1 Tax=Phaffia rhodozyma TaxID=264483 RepID=A0A0F7SMK5_PHARH|nr:hypothetical protein [Phaffia rhodozyma]